MTAHSGIDARVNHGAMHAGHRDPVFPECAALLPGHRLTIDPIRTRLNLLPLPRKVITNKNLLHGRAFSSDNSAMAGNEFMRKLKAYGKKRGVTVTLNASRGKGSHQTLYFGNAFTIIRNPKDELKTGTFRGMCSQLGIKPSDL